MVYTRATAGYKKDPSRQINKSQLEHCEINQTANEGINVQ